MKRLFAALLAFFLTIGLSACGGTSEPVADTTAPPETAAATSVQTTTRKAESTTQETTIPETAAEDISIARREVKVPTYAQTGKSGYDLTEDDFRELLLRANTFSVNWIWMFVKVDYEDSVRFDHVAFYNMDDADLSDPNFFDQVGFKRIISDSIRDLDELKATAKSIFSDEIYRASIESRYRMVDGKLYANTEAAGDAPPSEKYELTVESRGETECRLSLTEWDHGFNEGDPLSSHTSFYVIRRDDNGNWIFTGEFHPFTTTLDEKGQTVDLFDAEL